MAAPAAAVAAERKHEVLSDDEGISGCEKSHRSLKFGHFIVTTVVPLFFLSSSVKLSLKMMMMMMIKVEDKPQGALLVFSERSNSIVALYIVASASHTRLGLMARGYTGPTLKLSQSPTRRGASGLFSVYATAAGGLGAAIFSAFTYHMLRNKKGPFVSLWVVSIFRVLKWLVGMLHIVALSQGQSPTQLPLCPNHIHCPFLKILMQLQA
ncbi:hypothetical protein WN944_006914 [Citrus x changshan-huyou]|uniref:Uncharacterized protein n=1 Tax=Citrus x changshan-huyou TaxID=2935761 RepID=A0AAP0MM92_9ROSI